MGARREEDSVENNDSQPIIVKKVIKKGHGGGHHGGAWKVAYADFVTAMMAFFMVLWLVAMMSIEARKGVAEYFRSYTIFEGTEAGGGKGISVMSGNPMMLNKASSKPQPTQNKNNNIILQIKKTVNTQLRDLKNQILIFTTTNGVRLELVDLDDSPMFERGGARLVKRGRDILKVLAASLKGMPYKIAIEGHTDSFRFSRNGKTNWELAAARANAARRELIRNGLPENRISRVSSFADVVPLNGRDPFDPINRRVSILVEKNKFISAVGGGGIIGDIGAGE